MYKAITPIGGYKVGDEVPEDKAKIWAEMYVESPVEKIGGEPSVDDQEDVKEDALSPDEPTAESANAMHDDYINRNSDVVKKAIKEDDLDKSTLKNLLNLESANKKRKPVIDALKSKIKSL